MADDKKKEYKKAATSNIAAARSGQSVDINKSFDDFAKQEKSKLNNARINFLPRIVDAIFDYVRDEKVEIIDRELLKFLLLELGVFTGEFFGDQETEFDKNRWEQLLDYTLYKRKNAAVTQAEKGDVRLEEISDEVLLAEVERRKRLKPAFSALSPPTVAPKLWADRTVDDPDNASDFIRVIYARWLPNVLARQHLRELDYELYTAYAQRTRRGSKHEADKVEFAPKRHRSDRLSDEEAGARRHASAEAYNAKLNPP